MTTDPFYITLASSLAIHLGENILDAVSRKIRDKFSGEPQKEALKIALQEGLENSLAAFHLEEVDQNHFSTLFEKFLYEESVIDELTHLVDPRANSSLNLELLREKFNKIGFDENTLHFFSFDTFISEFGEAFYVAAAKQTDLQGVIEIGLLRSSVDQLGKINIYTHRTAIAAEQAAAATDEISETLEKFLQGHAKMADLATAIETAITRGFEQSYELQEKLISALYKNGYDITVSNGNVVIGDSNRVENTVTLQALHELQTEISRLRQIVDNQKAKEENLSIIDTRYRNHIIRSFERLTFQGMMRTAQAISLPLEDIYVELRAVGEVPEAADTFSVEERRLLLEIDDKDDKAKQDLMHHMDTLRRERWSRTSIDRKSITEALLKQDQRAFVILGDPGSGKSTLLHLLALVYAKGDDAIKKHLKASEQEFDRLPIFVPLAAYDDMLRTEKGMTLLEFLPRYYDRRQMITGLEPLFKRALESGKALVLFDGLDEVIDSTTRNYVASQVTALIREYTPRGVRFVMTSRFVGYREAPIGGDIPHLSVLDFGKEEIKTFIHKWAHTYETFAGGGKESPETIRLAHQLEKDLLEDVESISSVRRLAANPLMLTMLALLRRQVGRLPHRRIDLYKRYMDTIIENWVEARSHGEREHNIRLVDPHQAESFLIPLAFWLQSTQPSGTASKADIHGALTDIYLQEEGIDPNTAQRAQRKSAEDRAQQFLTDMRNMSGLIVERGYDAFGFLHLTFQEYFAGRALAQMEPDLRWEAIATHLHDPRWREPILLCAGQLGTVEKRKAQVSKFVEKILACDDPTENDLHRNLLLALSIACDDVNLEHTLLNTLVEKAMACLPTNVYILASEIINKLGQLIVNGVSSAEVCLSLLSNSKDTQFQATLISALKEGIEQPSIRQAILLRLNDQDWQVRMSAVTALTALVSSDADVRQAILQRLYDQDPDVRMSAVTALATLVSTNADVRQAILQGLNDKVLYFQRSAITVLTTLFSSNADVRQAILQRLDDQDWQVRTSTVTTLSTFVTSDADVRQAILQRINDQEPYVRNSAVTALTPLVSSDADVRQVVMQHLNDQDSDIRSSAVTALTALVSSDVDVRQAILHCLNDQNTSVRSSAVTALTALVSSDIDVRQAVLQRLNDQNTNVRSSAVTALTALVSSDIDVQEAIQQQLKDANWRTRLTIIDMLGQSLKNTDLIGHILPQIANSIQFLQSSEYSKFIAESLTLLKNFVSSDTDVRQAILQRLNDQDIDVRSSAITALTALVSSEADVRQAILQRLDDQDWQVRSSAVTALTALISSDAKVRQAILQRLDDQDSDVRSSAITALIPIFSFDINVRQAILQRLNDKESFVRSSAVAALTALASSDVDVRQAILMRLDDKESFVRRSAFTSLSTLISSNIDIRQAILQRLDDQDLLVRGYAITALTALISSEAAVRQVILQRLNDQASYLRSSAVTALTALVSSDTEVRQAILQRLDDQEPYVRGSAVTALTALVSSDPNVHQAILQHLDDQEPYVRSSAVTALTALVSSNADVRQAILQHLDDQDWEVRISAVRALTALVSSDADVRQAILLCLDDQNINVRSSAMLSLSKLEKVDIVEKGHRQKLVEWLADRIDIDYLYLIDRKEFQLAQIRLASLFSSRFKNDPDLQNLLLAWLKSPRWPTRLGAVRTLLQWPNGTPKDILQKILDSLNDNRGLDCYPARLTAAAYLINRDAYSKEAIQLGLEALEYGTLPWEYFPMESGEVRKQAALLLGTLEPVRYDQMIYDKLLKAMKADDDDSVRDTLYNVLVKLAGSKSAMVH